jgi:hypothetical protein
VPEYVFPLGGICVRGGQLLDMPPRLSPLTNMTLELRPHQDTEAFTSIHQHLEYGVRSAYYPEVDVIIHDNSGNDSENALNHAQEYWACLQFVSPSRCFLKIWHTADGSDWGTLRQSPSDNPHGDWEVNPSDLASAGEVWSNLQEHKRDAPDSHLLRAFPWLYRAVAAPASDLRLRALLFAIALETTLSPDSYKARRTRLIPKKMSLTDRFALRLGFLASRLLLPSLPRSWRFDEAARHIYRLRSTLVHGDSIRTDWTGFANLPPQDIESIATELYEWMYEAVRRGWTSAIGDRNYTHLLKQGPSVAAAYWE